MVKNRNKTRKKGLTASRKNRPSLPVDLRDKLNEQLRKIHTLASLMEASRHDVLRPEAVEDAGGFIMDEVEEIRALLRTVGTRP
jgi:hypothetical protein